MAEYTKEFYTGRRQDADLSADRVVPVILSYLQPKSVVDMGCGSGSWVAAFAKSGVPEVLGIDGPWATEHNNPATFLPFDFSTAQMPFKPSLPRAAYDLALSLEFAEHVSDSRANAVVDFLTGLAPVVVFSAAVPGQGGTGHVNEQWPAYWVEKFAARGYEVCDFLRPIVWNDADVKSWYRQNIMVFFKGGPPPELEVRLAKEARERLKVPMPLVHPAIHASKMERAKISRRLRVWFGKWRRKLNPLRMLRAA